MAAKRRLDMFLVEKGFFENRSKARSAIMAGKVLVNEELVDKAGALVKEDAELRIKGEILPYVSRGGFKLEKALKVFSIDVKNREAIDIGASTGGFTDCLLQNGAARVYAVDVGYGQLAWKLRNDPRVEVIERTNFRYLTFEELPVKVSLIVIDVSFISLRLIIPPALQFLTDDGDIIALIKPQFEAGPERVGKNGLIKDKKVHIEVLKEIIEFFNSINLSIEGLDFSPITGACSNNIEFLVHLKRNKSSAQNKTDFGKRIEDLVDEAHKNLERS
ncbi:MAG: TlyA family RNA methyltransferase [Halanaerobiaceae bacterium]|jgi:23S rRNA (cytidine1920-2'-O)/16S rRNA (cytidine1409-2'-O)-methyltransferase|nr:TlyA family RNA methyltransferase [Halanaerobiaceae bacterium]